MKRKELINKIKEIINKKQRINNKNNGIMNKNNEFINNDTCAWTPNIFYAFYVLQPADATWGC